MVEASLPTAAAPVEGLDEARLIERFGRRASVSAASRRRCCGTWATGSSGSRFRRARARRFRSWRSVLTGRCRSRIAKASASRCRRSSTSRSRWRRPIGWRFRRPASIGRWCANRISPARSATKRASRWRSLVNGRKRFRGHLAAVAPGPDGPAARMALIADDGSESEVELPIRAHGRGAARIDRRPHPRRAAAREGGAQGREASLGARGNGRETAPRAKRKTNEPKAAARGAASKPLGPDEGENHGR